MAKGDYNRLTQEQFEEKVHKHYPNLEILGTYKSAHSLIKYKCNVCGHIDEKEGNAFMTGHSGCKKCGGRIIIKGHNDFATLHPNLMIYLVNKEDGIGHSSTVGKVLCECPICHTQRYVKFSHLANPEKGFSCPKCGDGVSYPNRFMYCLLTQLNVDFDREKAFNWSQGRIYDFVIKSTIIEMDGGFHKGSKYKSYEECKKIDDLKDKLALENGYEIIRIDCSKSDFLFIKNNVINSNIKNVIDVNSIDWVSLEKELINNNMVSIAAKTFNEFKGQLSMKQISEKLNISSAKLCSLLKIGARVGLTDYKVEDSFKGKYTPDCLKKSCSKKVRCIETNKVYPSAAEAEREYDFNKDSISRVCRKERNSTHGLHFEYIE